MPITHVSAFVCVCFISHVCCITCHKSDHTNYSRIVLVRASRCCNALKHLLKLLAVASTRLRCWCNEVPYNQSQVQELGLLRPAPVPQCQRRCLVKSFGTCRDTLNDALCVTRDQTMQTNCLLSTQAQKYARLQRQQLACHATVASPRSLQQTYAPTPASPISEQPIIASQLVGIWP